MHALLGLALLVVGCHQDPVRIGDIAFVPRTVTVGDGPSAVAAADVNRDGHQDLLVAIRDHQLQVLLGDGRGEMVPHDRVPAGENPADLALADLDGDGDIDIVVANHETDYLTLLFGDGRGGFQPAPHSPLRIAVDPHPHAVRAADLDADGNVDLIVDHRNARGLLILRGLGRARFDATGVLVDVGGDPYRGMAVGDINGDGLLDFVTPNPRAVGVLLRTRQEPLAFHAAPSVTAVAPFAVELADLNGDTRLDLVAASDEGSSDVQFYWGDGRGAFREADVSPIRMGPGGKKATAGDFNGDGIQDVAVAGFQATDVLVIVGGISSVQTVALAGGDHPWGLAAVDLNHDGLDDLVIADDANARVTVYWSPGR